MTYLANTNPILIRPPGIQPVEGLKIGLLMARRGMAMIDEIVGMYELLDALARAIKTAPEPERRALADTLSAYSEHFPDDFFWAVGAQAPSLLSHLMATIDIASSGEGEKKGRVTRLIDRKPEGNA
jgi:hypothetical protein